MTAPTLDDEIAALRYCIAFLEANVPGHITAPPGFPKYTHLESALARLAAMQWRPIETAPKDGSFVDLLFKGSRMVRARARWLERKAGWFGWFDPNDCGLEIIFGAPTHWARPLPSRPEPQEGRR